MSVLRSKLVQAVVVVVAMYLAFRFGIQPPAPWSVVKIYMAVVLLAVLVYVSSDSDSWRAFLSPIQSTLVDEGRRPIRNVILVLVPILVAVYAYTQAAQRIGEPVELRAVHPAPPASITFRGKTIDIQGLYNPLRKDTANYEKYVAEGAAIYIKNCVFCHGDDLDGDGHFAHAFNPPPANFRDPGTIAMLQEGFLFWRIAKGGAGLPKESTPWNSVMPAWEDRLSEEEIWKVIMYLYDATGYQPRRWETHASVPVPSRPETQGFLSLILSRVEGPLSSQELAEAQQAGDVTRGKAVYEKKCALCHGTEGKGDGPGAVHLDPKPRDFTQGFYKIRTTGSGQLPTDEDVFRVITLGMPGSSMPSWRQLPEGDRRALVSYLKTFSPRFRTEPPGQVIDVGREVPATEESIEKGRKLYQLMECFTCHGHGGRGNGESAPELEDDWGYPIRPANLTKAWTYRGGTTPRDIVTRFISGLAGTPMPSYEGVFEDMEENWHLANYVRSLSPDGPDYATLITAEPVSGEIPLDPDDAFWLRIPQSNFPLVGQVVIDPRNFNPSIDMIAVRAVYSETEIAFHLTWDDPTFSKADPGGKTIADQVALQFPAGLPEGTERPYVLMGDSGNPAYLLRWSGDTGVTEANAAGVGKLTPQTGDQLQAKGKVVFGDGRYRLVIKRPRAAEDSHDLEFPVGQFLSVAFMAWDGGAGEAGSQMSLSSWYYLLLEPPPSRKRWVYPPLAALGVVGLELWGLRWARRRAQR